ncbi:MAG: toll/interleukin-1 receptor domain-containing protein [Rubrivivax sp.]
MATVFISYRRQDSDAFADAISDEFERRLGSENVFLDVKGIDLGADFSVAIRERIRRVSVVLVLIGANWLTARDASGQVRIEKDDD